MKRLLSMIIPCYGSESCITDVVNELERTLAQRQWTDYEIILVSDSSPDGVFGVISELAAENPRVKGLELARNFGQHAALMAGYRHCAGDIIISLDDDGQTPPEAIFKLTDKLDEGYDVVYALYPEVRQTWGRRLASRINKYMMEKLLDKPKDIVANSYFACRRFVLDEIIRYENPYPYIGGLVFRATRHVAAVPVEHHFRREGRSGYTLSKLVGLWSNGFTAFSVVPLRAASVLGLLSAFFGFAMMAYTIVHKLFNPNVPQGYSSMMAVILLMGGLIMMMLGVMGEYLGRTYISANNAPQYVVRRSVNLADRPGGPENRATPHP